MRWLLLRHSNFVATNPYFFQSFAVQTTPAETFQLCAFTVLCILLRMDSNIFELRKISCMCVCFKLRLYILTPTASHLCLIYRCIFLRVVCIFCDCPLWLDLQAWRVFCINFMIFSKKIAVFCGCALWKIVNAFIGMPEKSESKCAATAIKKNFTS